MSGKSLAWRERRLGYRRHKRNEKAVSPVVATLILILIAVAAAAALYLWLTGWQGSVTSSIGKPSIPSDLKFSIGGSTTVYPLSQLAIKWYEQNNTNNNITDQQGGSVAGVEAWCLGHVDVAAASSSFTTSQLIGDGCSASLADNAVQTVVAVDGLVGIVSTKNPGVWTHATAAPAGKVPSADISFNATTMYALYAAASSKTPVTNTLAYPGQAGPAYTLPNWLCGTTAVSPADTLYKTCLLEGVANGGNHGFTFGVIPFPAGCNVALALPVVGGCVWGTLNTNTTATYDRADSGGTEQGFSQKYLAIPKDGSSNSCGTDNQLESCNIIATHHEVGNVLVAAGVAADPNGIGFNSYGQASANPGVIIGGYQGLAAVGQTQQTTPILPTIPNVLGTYKGTVTGAASYQPWRVLEYVTNGVPPVGSIESNYIQFVLGSSVNQALGVQTGYISLYAA
ncbi:MAG: archaellin/type IV pilin N-terminal domain-containing protein [Thermoplasmata archaeon]